MFTDAAGVRPTVATLDNTGVNGDYLTSEGKKGDAVWGTRGKWAMLSGTVGGEPVTIAILDHPKNPGYPTYWHARGYGLFAANPLGQKALSNGKDVLNFTLEPPARPPPSATASSSRAAASGAGGRSRVEGVVVATLLKRHLNPADQSRDDVVETGQDQAPERPEQSVHHRKQQDGADAEQAAPGSGFVLSSR